MGDDGGSRQTSKNEQQQPSRRGHCIYYSMKVLGLGGYLSSYERFF